MTARVTADDLLHAATWLEAYEGEGGVTIAAQDPEEDDDHQAVLRRVSEWLTAEAHRRAEAAAERVAIREVAARNGRSISDPAVRAAVRRVRRRSS